MNKGAIEIDTNKYILPQYALKGVNYKCFDETCNRFVRRVKKSKTGAITHFRHLKADGGEDCVCERYSLNRVLTADEIHKDAILNLKYLLENNEITKKVVRYCSCCKDNRVVDKEIEKLEQDERIIKEHSFSFNGSNSRADIARIGIDGKLKEIYEIKHTHATKEGDRPVDIEWYEIDATKLNKKIGEIGEIGEIGDNIILECERINELCFDCLEKKKRDELVKIEQERCNAIKKKQLEQQELERKQQQELERCNAVKQDKKQEKQEQKGRNSNWCNYQPTDDEYKQELQEERRQFLIAERIKRNNFLKYRQELFLKSKEEKSIKEQEQKLI